MTTIYDNSMGGFVKYNSETETYDLVEPFSCGTTMNDIACNLKELRDGDLSLQDCYVSMLQYINMELTEMKSLTEGGDRQ